MGAIINTQKIPRTSNESKKIPEPKINPQKLPCPIFEPQKFPARINPQVTSEKYQEFTTARGNSSDDKHNG